MKRVLSIILTIIFMLSISGISAFAGSDLPIIDIGSFKVTAVTVSQSYAAYGESVTVTAKISGNSTVSSAALKLAYGADVITVPMTYDSSTKICECTFTVDDSFNLGEWSTKSLFMNNKSTATISTSIKKSFTVVKYGDINNDNRVNSTDALLVLQKVVGNYSFSDAQVYAANVNKDSKISSYDALQILMFSVGEIDKF